MTTAAPSTLQRSQRALVAPLAVGVAIIAATIWVVADPNPHDGPVICLFRRTTGFWCPGCGLTRATHYLLRGDFVTAFSYHLLVIPVLALLALAWVSWLATSMGRPAPLVRVMTPVFTWVMVGVFVAFVVVRNLPGMEFLVGG